MNTETIILILLGVIAGVIGNIFSNFISGKFFSRKTFNTSNAVELLMKGRPEEWNEVRILNQDWTPNLKNIDLSNKTLPLANFGKADMTNAAFANAILDGANFQEANLEGASFQNSSLVGTNFSKANLISVNFEDAKLDGAYFENAILDKDHPISNMLHRQSKKSTKKFLIQKIIKDPNVIDTLGPTEFEELVFYIFKMSGFEIESSHPNKDFGYDFIATKEDPLKGKQTYIIEVKKTPKDFKVGLSSLRALYAGLLEARADQAILVTAADATQSASSFAEEASIQIIDRQELLDWLKRLKHQRQKLGK